MKSHQWKLPLDKYSNNDSADNMVPKETYQRVFTRIGDGEEVLQDLCSIFYDRSSYTQGDPYHTAFQEGQRSVISFIINKLSKQLEEQGDMDE